MNRYFAVFRVKTRALPETVSFDGKSVSDAIDKLVSIAKLAGVDGFSEYEIHEVIGNRKYRSVAIKLPPGQRPSSVQQKTAPEVEAETPVTPPSKPNKVGFPYPDISIGSI